MIINYVNNYLTRWNVFFQLTHTADDAKAKHVVLFCLFVRESNCFKVLFVKCTKCTFKELHRCLLAVELLVQFRPGKA